MVLNRGARKVPHRTDRLSRAQIPAVDRSDHPFFDDSRHVPARDPGHPGDFVHRIDVGQHFGDRVHG